ncbi:nitroreductase [Actinoplanes sp. NPDC026619]|uniref:nitroreductase n=1 Tax=Actinoplanes sp. NPDC026619 TaxID=3155798 RepID=UPI0033EC5B7C
MIPAPPRPAGRIMNEAFYRAVVAAGRAPSAHNTQPWRWRVNGGLLDLFADHDRMAGVSDPDGRLTVISCGAALHHARLTLAAHGWRATVTRRPDAGDPTHLARLTIDGAAPVSPDTAELARAIKRRHTDQRPVTGRPIEPATLQTIGDAFQAQRVHFGVLRPDQILALAVATAGAASAGPANAQWHAELARWAGSDRIVAAPDGEQLPAASAESDRAATFAVLHGPADQALDWLHVGEALSAGALVAAGLGVSVLPFSAPIEHADAGRILGRAIPELGSPYVMLRLGHHATEADTPPTPRLPAAQTMESAG